MGLLLEYFCVLLVLAILPLVPNVKLRYYACYAFYIIYSSLSAVLLSPLLLFYPHRDPRSIGKAAEVTKYLTHPLGITWVIKNKEKLKKGQPAIIVANHQSMFDVLGMQILHKYQGTFTSIGAKKLLYFFPWGPIGWMGGLLFVDRNAKTSRSRDNAARQAQEQLKKGVKIWIYPEGTRNSTNKQFVPFKKGAFHLAIDCQMPIIPVVFSPYTFIDHKNKTFKKGKVIVSVLDEIPTKGLSKKDLDALLTITQRRMSDEYGRLMRELENS